jgi:hypothetical protein
LVELDSARWQLQDWATIPMVVTDRGMVTTITVEVPDARIIMAPPTAPMALSTTAPRPTPMQLTRASAMA